MTKDIILQNIIEQKAQGMNIDRYFIQPARITVNEQNHLLNLNNVVYILNTPQVPDNYDITIISTDNVFQIDTEKYDSLADAKYQVFTDYMKITTVLTDALAGHFEPYVLEFVKLIPIKD